MASEFKKKLFWRAVAAEFLAMTLFVFISIGSALGFNYPLKNNQTSGAMQDNVKVSLAFGLSIATLAQSVGHISGAHLNPAVTLGLLLSCQISILRAITYMVAQCVGAIVATAILSGITSSLSDNSLGRNAVSGGPPPRPGAGVGGSRMLMRHTRLILHPLCRWGCRGPGSTRGGRRSCGVRAGTRSARGQSLLPARHCGKPRPAEQRSHQCPLRAPIVSNKLGRQLRLGPAAPHPSALPVRPAPSSCSLDPGETAPLFPATLNQTSGMPAARSASVLCVWGRPTDL